MESTIISSMILLRRNLSRSLIAVFSIVAGIVVGKILRNNNEPISAVSSNMVADNNDQSIGEIVIEQTSIVTVRNSEANYGYA